MKVTVRCSTCGQVIGSWSLSGHEQEIEVHPCLGCINRIMTNAKGIAEAMLKERK